MKFLNGLGWGFFVFLAIGVGIYPWFYVLIDQFGENALLASKTPEILASQIWNVQFYIHIFLGSIAMLTGWSQFMKKFRNKNLNFHRTLGKVYVIAVIFSGLSGLYVAYFANGGIVAQLGFSGLALAWLFTTSKAYLTIRKKQVDEHKKWMLRSYALTWAAVTLRIYLPLFEGVLGMEFITAYVIIAWLCWVPNLIWAEWRIKRLAI